MPGYLALRAQHRLIERVVHERQRARAHVVSRQHIRERRPAGDRVRDIREVGQSLGEVELHRGEVRAADRDQTELAIDK